MPAPWEEAEIRNWAVQFLFEFKGQTKLIYTLKPIEPYFLR